MLRKNFSLIFVLLAGAGWLAIVHGQSRAAPMPPRPVVNPETRECALVVPGDECGDLVLPAGWQYLEPASDGNCPADYAVVELQAEWAGFKIPRCCTAGHSGASGDCTDMVVQEKDHLCAFVEDLSACPALPEGWAKSGPLCPQDYNWLDDLACLIPTVQSSPSAAPPTDVPPATAPPLQATPTGSSQPTPQPTAANTVNSLPCGSAGMLLAAGLLLTYRELRPVKTRKG
jgi:hypothetical protein